MNRFVFAIFMQCIAVSVAEAQLSGHLYVNAGLGGVLGSSSSGYTADSSSLLYAPTTPGTSLFILPGVHWQNKYDNGFDANLAVGYRLSDHWRSEVEFLYQYMQRDVSGDYNWQEYNSSTMVLYAASNGNPIAPVTAPANVYSLLANTYYDFPNTTKWTPLIGAGIGIAWINSTRTTGNAILNVDDPSIPLVQTAPVSQTGPSLYGTALALQFKAGISYAYKDDTTVSLVYRLFGTSQFKASNSYIVSNPGTSSASTFYVPGHDVGGILTNALEVNVSFAL